MVKRPDAGAPLEGVLNLVPLAWLALVAYGWLTLLALPGSADRPTLPGVQAAERAVAPLLCLIAVAAIIKRFASRPPGEAARPPGKAAQREGPATR